MEPDNPIDLVTLPIPEQHRLAPSAHLLYQALNSARLTLRDILDTYAKFQACRREGLTDDAQFLMTVIDQLSDRDLRPLEPLLARTVWQYPNAELQLMLTPDFRDVLCELEEQCQKVARLEEAGLVGVFSPATLSPDLV